MRLGRRLLEPTIAIQNSSHEKENEDIQTIQLNDRFFTELMEMIPPQYYFPTDEEENWLKSVPKAAKKYHRDVMASSSSTIKENGFKNNNKRTKFNPKEQKTNEERQLEIAEKEKKQQHIEIKEAKDPSQVGIEGLKQRLALKIQHLREQRKANEGKTNLKGENNKKRKDDKVAEESAFHHKKRKTLGSFSSTTNTKTTILHLHQPPQPSNTKNQIEQQSVFGKDSSSSSISYGSLLLDDSDSQKPMKKKTRNGQSVRGIQNLLKKAERNQKRLLELKKTEKGKKIVQEKEWEKAIQQAKGEILMDDPKLLRKKLKKKEKTKLKSKKEWQNRIIQQQQQKQQKQKNKKNSASPTNNTTGMKTEKKHKSTGTGATSSQARAGFEGKKGESFLNKNK